MSDAREKAVVRYPVKGAHDFEQLARQEGFVAGAEWAKADLPDRNEVSKALMLAAGIHGPIATRDERGEIVVNMTPLADAILALFRGEEPK